MRVLLLIALLAAIVHQTLVIRTFLRQSYTPAYKAIQAVKIAVVIGLMVLVGLQTLLPDLLGSLETLMIVLLVIWAGALLVHPFVAPMAPVRSDEKPPAP